MLMKEMEIYALGSLVDSGWMHLDGWRHRACKRGNARACVYIVKRGNVHRVVLQVGAVYSLVETAISRYERHDSLQRIKETFFFGGLAAAFFFGNLVAALLPTASLSPAPTPPPS
ncbi:hypothetical protein EV424DRAFT_1352525 [Suillus variegatus]|nr:hypothetical protein EV424DRAFT_1352525 [Suillus variegatus]